MSTALNTAIKNMNGQWLSWLSHDDLYLPQKIKKQIEFINNLLEKDSSTDLKKTIVHCHSEHIDADGNIIFKFKPLSKEGDSPIKIILDNIRINRLGGCNFLLPKECFYDVGLFSEEIKTISDYDFWYRLLLNGYNFHFIPDVLVQGRMHSKQITYTLNDLGKKESEQFHTWVINFIFDKTEYKKAIYFMKLGMYTRQRALYSCSKLAYFYAKELSNNPFRSIDIFFRNLYADLFRFIKSNLKKAFVKVKIKNKK